MMVFQKNQRIATGEFTSYYQRVVRRYGEGFFAIYKKANRVAAHAEDIAKLWKKLKEKNVDLKKVVIARLPPARWRYKS
jgi:hypothetical protein